MMHSTWFSRRIVIGLVAVMVMLGGPLLQTDTAQALGVSGGKHYTEATIESSDPAPLWWCRSWWCD